MSRLGNNGRLSVAAAAAVEIRVDARYDTPPERAFDAWLDAETAAKWLFATATRPPAHVAIDARVGGAFRIVEAHEHGGLEHCGSYIEIAAPRRLAFNLVRSDRPSVTMRVTVEIGPRGRGCSLSLVHEHVSLDLVAMTETRWIGMLYGLGVMLGSAVSDPHSRRSSIAPDIVLPRLVPVRAAPRGEIQPGNPRRQ